MSKNGIYIDLDRIKEVKEICPPYNKKSMQSFFGHINFVKRFVSDFSQIIFPLQQMINKDTFFKWGQHEKKAFNFIKESIINAPSLNTPNFSNHFILYTFSSSTSYVVVLTQINIRKLKHPSHFSTQISKVLN